MVAESAGVPLPSEVIMPVGGLLSTTPGALVFAIAAGTAGNVAGSWIAYLIGAAIGYEWRGSGHAKQAWETAHAWFRRRGPAAVLIGRVLPVVRTYISFPAGAAGMPLGRFLAYTALGSAVWSAALATAGYALRAQWPEIANFVHRYTIVTIAALVVIAAVAALMAVRRSRSR